MSEKVLHDIWIDNKSKRSVVTLAIAINCSDAAKEMVVCCPIDNKHLILVYDKNDFFDKYSILGDQDERTDSV